MPRARGARVSLLRRIPISHVRVAPFIVNNRPETMDRSRRSFPTAAGWFRARSRCRLACQNAADDARPHAEEAAKPPSRSMRAHPSSSFETCARAFEVCRTPSARALLRMRTSIASFTAHDVKQPISFPRRVSAPGVCNFASLTPNEGGRSADPPPVHPHVASGCPRPLQRLSFLLLRRPHVASTILRVHHSELG